MIPTDILASDYLAGHSYRSLSSRHGLSPSAIFKRLQAVVDDGRYPDFVQARESNWQLRIEQIAAAVSKAFCLRPGRIWNPTRQADALHARYAVFLIAEESGLPQAAASRAFEMNRSSVSYATRRGRALAATDFDFAAALKRARKALAA